MPVLITQPPASQLVRVGTAAVFSVQVSGSSPFTYQWYRFGTNLPGATNSSLALTNVQFADAGNYCSLFTDINFQF